MKIRFYIDPETRLPHIYNHNVREDEGEDDELEEEEYLEGEE